MRYVIAAPVGRMILYLKRAPNDRVPDRLNWVVDKLTATALDNAADAVALAFACGDDTWVEECLW